MATQYRCQGAERRERTRREGRLNGIDFLEVLDLDLLGPDLDPALAALRQRVLLVHLFLDAGALDERNVRIVGGRRTAAHAELARRADAVAGTALDGVAEVVTAHAGARPQRVLAILTDSSGDFSPYRLALVQGAEDPRPPEGFDSQLASVRFTFKVECPTDFDCDAPAPAPLPAPPEVPIDYLAKDYASFRQLMLDRLSTTIPEWRERSPADLGVALVETLAYAADQLSYHQDAVATEAYLGTARRRVSMRRHARLVDYPMHEGANARAWVAIRWQGDPGQELPGPGREPHGTRLLTRMDGQVGVRIDERDLPIAVQGGAQVFETLHPLALYSEHNDIQFYTWGADRCCLPKGATRATLRDPWLRGDGPDSGRRALADLRAGDVLIFEEVAGELTQDPADADPAHRHAVRLVEASPGEDTAENEPSDPRVALGVLEIAWDADDALPFSLCLDRIEDEAVRRTTPAVSVARGNVVLADHGRTIERPADQELAPVPTGRPFRTSLALAPLTHQARVRERQAVEEGTGDLVPVDLRASAGSAFAWDMAHVTPAVRVVDDRRNEVWTVQRDLLASDRFAPHFVVEMESGGEARLRFGDGISGRRPVGGSTLRAEYRIGSGRAGNVGAEAIAHVVSDLIGFEGVRNPLPAQGGEDPEPLEQVRLNAPEAFRVQERAVTEADYAELAERHPEVQKAMATRRWTGSWHTMFVTIDRRLGRPVDATFEAEMRQYLERFRLTGYDVEIDAPSMAALQIEVAACAKPSAFRSDVTRALLAVLSNTDLPDGRRGLFHPDNFTFGRPLFLSRVVAAAMSVPGVSWVEVRRFGRFGAPLPARDPVTGARRVPDRIGVGRLEIIRLDNDPSAPENGRLELDVQGGL